MFGTVTSGMIADQLKTQFDVSIDKKKIHLESPIRTLGEHEVELKLYHEVNATLKVRVESSTPVAAPVEEAPDRGDKTEKRARRTTSAPAAEEAPKVERKSKAAKA